ncbi:dipeptidase PepV [Aerococcaceae bacterium DSM 111020]|nr:dipeptidase PepV [Aerococcaceae bacterium DSM 111020]
MNINWLNEVEQRKEALLEDLFRLLRIDSVRDDENATEDAPVGPGPKRALEEFLAMAEEDGFKTKQFGPWAGHLEIGKGEEILGILGHLDVVPAGSGWNTDPFEPQIIDDRVYARGSSDDKGPTIAAYFAIKMLQELGVEFEKKIHFIVGTDEESGWQDMDYYFEHAPMPDFGFSPDATFPIINGEKGNVSAILEIEPGSGMDGQYTLISFKSGLRSNMVPEQAVAILEGPDLEDIAAAFDAFINEYTYLNGSSVIQDDEITLTLNGKSAHGSTPEKGYNAATFLANFLMNYEWDLSASDEFIQLLGDLLHEDFDAVKIGAPHHDDLMGDVSMNVGIANYVSEKGTIDANFRFPQGTSPEAMQENIEATVAEYDTLEVSMTEAKTPHYVSGDDPLVRTLLDVYEKQTGFEGHEQVIGGGTFGRLMPRGVAYGALFPDSTDTMHQANEFISLTDLFRATAIYAEAIYRLTRADHD